MHMCLPVMVQAASSTVLNRRSFLLLIQLSPRHSINIMRHTALGLSRVTQALCLLSWWERFFPCCVPLNDMVNFKSVVGIGSHCSVVVIGYQADKFTHTWSSEHFIAQSHIYLGLIGKVSSLTHFPLKPGCEDYSMLDQEVEDLEHYLDSVLKSSVHTPELDTSFDKADALPYPTSSGHLCSVSTSSDNSRLQLAPSTKSFIFWWPVWGITLPVPLADKSSPSKFIHYYLVIQQHLDSELLHHQ